MAPAAILNGLSSAEAATHVPRASHSIVEIVAHMEFWQSWFLQRCDGAGIPPPATASLGWPPAGAADWEPLRDRLLSGLERASALGADRTTAARRIAPAIEFPPLANYTVAEAVTHIGIHNAHHLGQIIVLRQMLGVWPPPDGSYTW
jgi:uncharacterized damage-inducible protein DinB